MNNYEQIEAYLEGGMTADEKAEFERKMQEDPQLLSAFNLYRQADAYLQNEQRIDSGEADLRNTISTAINEQKTNSPEPPKQLPTARIRWRYVAAAAACIAVLLLLRPVIFSSETDTQKLYSQYAIPEKLDAGTRGDARVDSILKLATVYFNEKDYAKAIPELDRFLAIKPGESKYQLARAFALLETGDYNRAETALQNIESGASAYKSLATWYRALSLLKQQKTGDCKQLLQTIIDSKDPDIDTAIKKNAKDLLEEL
ncbi:MAG: tetratricopeptide repeat protein [Bacteroidota bacterium]